MPHYEDKNTPGFILVVTKACDYLLYKKITTFTRFSHAFHIAILRAGEIFMGKKSENFVKTA